MLSLAYLVVGDLYRGVTLLGFKDGSHHMYALTVPWSSAALLRGGSEEDTSNRRPPPEWCRELTDDPLKERPESMPRTPVTAGEGVRAHGSDSMNENGDEKYARCAVSVQVTRSGRPACAACSASAMAGPSTPAGGKWRRVHQGVKAGAAGPSLPARPHAQSRDFATK